MFAKQPGQIWPRRNAVELRGRREKGLHLPRRLKSGRQPTDLFAHMRPDVRNTAGSENGVTASKLEALLAHLDHIVPVHDVEPLLLAMMEVPRGASLPVIDLLPGIGSMRFGVGTAREFSVRFQAPFRE